MRRKFPIAILSVGFCASASGAQVTQSGKTWSPIIPAAAAQADFDVLRNSLEEAHGALYRFVPKAEMDARFVSTRAKLDHEMSRVEMHGILSELIAGIGDGHTRVDFDDSTNAAMTRAKVLPLRLSAEGGKMVVAFNDDASDTTIVPGMEITSINGVPVADLASRILPKMSRDGFIETGRQRRLGQNFPQLYWLYVNQAPLFDVEARRTDGASVRATLQGIVDADRRRANRAINTQMQANALALDLPAENVSFRFGRDSSVGIVRIRGFGGEKFNAEVDSVIRLARDTHVRSLLLDLRGNGGGVDMYGVHLVSVFTDKPFRYFDHIAIKTIKPSFATWKQSTFDDLQRDAIPNPAGGYLASEKIHPGVVEQKPSATPFLGKLIVLEDGGTFSTAADVTAMLRSMNRATFVGEESGGAYEGNTSGLNATLALPNSGLKFRVQMFGYVNAVRPLEKGRGTLADIVVARSVSDVLAGRDAALERALAAARAP